MRRCTAYGCLVLFVSERDPLSQLVSGCFSHRTKNADSTRAFAQRRERFPTREGVRDADEAGVREALAPCTWPEQKAPRPPAVLRAISTSPRGLTLDWLADVPVPEALAWLEALPGVGPKTSAAVPLCSRLRRPALPVDSQHHRVAVRLRLLDARVAVGPSHEIRDVLLPPGWDAQAVYDHHEALLLHRQRCCVWGAPGCGRCPEFDLCVWPDKDAARGAEGTPGERSAESGVSSRPRARTACAGGARRARPCGARTAP